jgi:hypothetical protein
MRFTAIVWADALEWVEWNTAVTYTSRATRSLDCSQQCALIGSLKFVE